MKNEVSNWRTTAFSWNGQASVPDTTGVYVILRVRRVMGLPLSADPIYVGKTKNLRKRMGSHLDPAKAHNERVGALPNRETVEFWCNLLPGDQIAEAEKDLIRVINPQANKIRYQTL